MMNKSRTFSVISGCISLAILLTSLVLAFAGFVVPSAIAASPQPQVECDDCTYLGYTILCDSSSCPNPPNRDLWIDRYRCCDVCYGGGCQYVNLYSCVNACP